MNKKSIVSIIIAFVIGIAGFGGYQTLGNGRSEAATNMMGGLTAFSTSTNSGALPVKLLDLDSNRRYVVISNTSATAAFLYFTTDSWTLDGSGTPATSTITSLNGVYLAGGASYEINPDNLIYGNIWASSTASGVKLNINYK